MGPEWIAWISKSFWHLFEQCFGFKRKLEAIKDAGKDEIIEIYDEEAAKWILFNRKNKVQGFELSLDNDLNKGVEDYFKSYCAEHNLEYIPPQSEVL